MTAPTAAPALPKLDTPEARWKYVLTLWHTHSLPAPLRISVKSDAIFVTLEDNACRGVDLWAEALGCGFAASEDNRTSYAARTVGEHYPRYVYCYTDEPATAPITPELTAAIDGVVAMLTEDKPNPVCNKQLGVESHCARDAGHDGDCNLRVPQMTAFWKNEDNTVGQECVCGVTLDGFEPKDRALLDELFAQHECNTLPPVCGFARGCNLGPDLTPAPAEPDGNGLCAQHLAEVYPTPPCEYGCTDSVADATCPEHGVKAFLVAQREQEFGGAL